MSVRKAHKLGLCVLYNPLGLNVRLRFKIISMFIRQIRAEIQRTVAVSLAHVSGHVEAVNPGITHGSLSFCDIVAKPITELQLS